MIDALDNILNRITMYRLMIYYLVAVLSVASILGIIHLVPYPPTAIIFSTLFILLISIITNNIFASVFKAPSNSESVYITALILALIVSPARRVHDLAFLGWVAGLSVSSKYILAINYKHIFNPAAFAVAATALAAGDYASWWVGQVELLPVVLIGGLLIIHKIQKEDMAFAFLATAILLISMFTVFKGGDVISTIDTTLLHSSLLFLAFVMLTEPTTTPPTFNGQTVYALIVGFLYAPEIHFGNFGFTSELALLAGNLFSYLVSPKEKLVLYSKDKIQIAPDTFDFVFNLPKKLAYVPGQYMEWTLAHDKVDSRGLRRYFTLASSPTENNLRLGVKIYKPTSSFKQALLNLDHKTPIVAGARGGDFTLPDDLSQKLVLVAGGIGITPYRSMMKYLIDTGLKRDIVLFYSNKTASEIVYNDVLNQAQQELGIRVVYTLTDKNNIPPGWQGQIGRIDEAMIRRYVPDFRDRLFYLSGPIKMVNGFEEVLRGMGVKRIKRDFFPGF